MRCIRARPEQDGLLTIEYPDVPAGQAIASYYGVERAGRLMYKRRPVDFNVAVDGKSIYSGRTQSDNKMHLFNAAVAADAGDSSNVSFSVRADNISKRYFCFYAQMVDLK